MKNHVDKSRGIVTLITEALAKIKPTESLRLAKQASLNKVKLSDCCVFYTNFLYAQID